MFGIVRKLGIAVILLGGSMSVGALFSYRGSSGDRDTSLAQSAQEQQPAPLPTFIRSPNRNVILPSVTPPPTPTATLLPPPTFEPPTATPTVTTVPSQTPTPTVELNISIPGLNGAETPTPTSTPGCEPRQDWKLTYTVQFDDTLSSIAARYSTWVEELAEGNCIQNKDLIVVGQVLRVPGETHPYVPEVACVPWEVLTPINGAVTVPADGTITFNWRGPLAPMNLIRIYLPDGTTYEQLVELRQNDTINLTEHLPLAGTYTWYVYPLGRDFKQIECLEGGPWTFYKPASESPSSAGGVK